MSDEKQTDFSNIRELWTTNIEISKDVYGPTLDDILIERLQNRIDELKEEKNKINLLLIASENHTSRNEYSIRMSVFEIIIAECERFKRSLEL